MVQVRLVVEYDGSGFYGWQKQPELRTVQRQLEETLSLVLRQQVGPLYAAGRTDSGVHARGQVVTFRIPEPPDLFKLARGVSHLLKGELAVVSADIVPDDFHPGFSSKRKQYCYTILNRPTPPVLEAHRVWHIGHYIDFDLMQECAAVLVGEQDFSSLRDSGCTGTTPVKTIYTSELSRVGDTLTYTVVGNGFLKQMVRNIVGTITDIGRGRLKQRSMRAILDKRDRRFAGVTAPPHGLCLDWVAYE